MIVPLKLGRNVVGCLEVANKRGTQEFTDNDMNLLKMISEKVAAGLISFEMKQ
jgi:GAF domain-containing protein